MLSVIMLSVVMLGVEVPASFAPPHWDGSKGAGQWAKNSGQPAEKIRQDLTNLVSSSSSRQQ